MHDKEGWQVRGRTTAGHGNVDDDDELVTMATS